MITEESARPTTAGQELGGPPLGDPPRRRLSPVRVVLFLALVAAVAYCVGHLVVTRSPDAAVPGRATPAFAPYVDVTLTPTYPFQSPAADPVASAYLGFVVTRSSAPCTPTWGGFYTLAAASRALDLDARIAQLRAQGGHAMVSFGGQDNSEPAVTCTSQTKLRAAYLAPVERYHATGVDLDVEGAGLTDTAADGRRAAAIAAVQQHVAGEGRHLAVWLTLPVSAQGLTPEGVAAVRAMLAHHVDLTGINVMAMDFGPGQGAATDMFATVRRALFAAHAQAQALYGVGSSQAWQHLGVTVMLGVNDVPGERFTIDDARRLAALAGSEGLPRVSAWSLNRDTPCGGAFAQVGVSSNTCSGVAQSPLQFTSILSHLKGTTIARDQVPDGPAGSVATPAVDRPADSPYPIWQATAAYNTSYKVVWHRDIYQAKWWTQGAAPDAISSATTPSAWQLIGPVGPNARAPEPRLLVSAHPPRWSAKRVYHAGDRVRFGGLPFQARYYTQGDQPVRTLPADPQSPWQPLFTDPGEPTAAGMEAGA
jgi:chitinase